MAPTRDSRMREITMDDVADDDQNHELEVNFFPQLNLQRRIWILNIIRRESISKVLDIGCGEGDLLNTLSQVAPWLAPPPPSVLEPESLHSPSSMTSPVSAQLNPTNRQDPDSIPNLHITHIHGLDISDEDLQFAVQATKPPEVEDYDDPISPHPLRRYSTTLTRFEELDVRIWKGGLETINEEFVDMECIVSSEVIEHLPPSVLPFFVPIILGVYHPKSFLMTTPSYTYNARFTAPDAPSSARKGYPDPTQRTNRIFRHSDHKFEWTTDEFEAWVTETGKTWGYSVHWAAIGRATTPDPYGRDDELGGASFVAEFRKLGDEIMTDSQRSKLGRETVQKLAADGDGTEINKAPHELLAHHFHAAHPFSQRPRPLPEIAQVVKAKMEEYREAFMRLEELWYENEVAVACGGWIELLAKAVEESAELLLKKEEDGIQRKRDSWTVEIIGAPIRPKYSWNEGRMDIYDQDAEDIPPDWTPGEGYLDATDSSDKGDSTGVDGDVSLCGSEEDGTDTAWTPDLVPGKDWLRKPKRRSTWGPGSLKDDPEQEDSDTSWTTDSWGPRTSVGGWGEIPDDQKKHKRPANQLGGPTTVKKERERNNGNSSTAGWDGDADSDTE